LNQKREHDTLSATGITHAIEELQNEVATLSQLLYEQTNGIVLHSVRMRLELCN
jgi:hypothetical protein